MYGNQKMIYARLEAFYGKDRSKHPNNLMVIHLEDGLACAWIGSRIHPPHGIRHLIEQYELKERRHYA
jgi:hypothetical protein